ncbi:MAG: hypothetical protein OXG97_09835 [Candidatus Poribacteria bacterium]|nr:hypothetical protein [Candidatus Poribacteria bacterium]
MPKFHLTQILKIEPQPIYAEINAASASVWNECLTLMNMYQWHRGYPHVHDHFYIGNACEGWVDKKLPKNNLCIHRVSKRFGDATLNHGSPILL